MSNPVKIFLKGSQQDFIVFVDSEAQAEKYKRDPSIALADVVSNFKIYSTENGRGAEGILDEASKQDLENQFGKKSEDEIISFIIKEGSVKSSANIDKKTWNSTNDTIG